MREYITKRGEFAQMEMMASFSILRPFMPFKAEQDRKENRTHEGWQGIGKVPMPWMLSIEFRQVVQEVE